MKIRQLQWTGSYILRTATTPVGIEYRVRGCSGTNPCFRVDARVGSVDWESIGVVNWAEPEFSRIEETKAIQIAQNDLERRLHALVE